MKNYIAVSISVLAIILAIVACAVVLTAPAAPRSGTMGSAINNPQFASASSTAISVTTGASVRLLATSSRRVAAYFETHNCVTSGGVVFLAANNDIAATINTGFSVNASSSLALSAYPNLPVPTGSVQAIAGVNNCTVLVTEWRVAF